MITPNDIRDKLQMVCRLSGSQAAVARRIGVAPQFISKVLDGQSPPSDKILAALGLERIVVYRPIAGRKGKSK